MAAADSPNVEEIIKRWALDMFDVTKSKEQAKISKDSLMMTVDWKNVRFRHHPPEYTDVAQPPSPKAQVLFKTHFSNNTVMEQEYSFKTERVTRSSCEIFIEKGVTVGQEMSVKLQTPCEVFEANAGFHREVTLTNSQGELIEEEMTWEVDSQIKVPPNTKTVAQLVITEDQYSGAFIVNSEFSGKITVALTNLRDNNSFVKSIVGDVSEIIKREVERGMKGLVVNKKIVSFQTSGRCNFRYAIEQHVNLEQHPLIDEKA